MPKPKTKYILELRVLEVITDDKGKPSVSEVPGQSKILDSSTELKDLTDTIEEIDYFIGD